MNNVFIMKKRILYALGAALLVFGVVVLIHVDRGAITNMYNLLLLLVVGIGVSSLVMIWAIYPLVSTSKKGLLVLFFGGALSGRCWYGGIDTMDSDEKGDAGRNARCARARYVGRYWPFFRRCDCNEHSCALKEDQ